MYEENTTCIKGYSCKDVGGYLYQGENVDECVSVKKCLEEKKGHAYSDLGECLKIDLTPNGNNIERADNIYSCVSYSTEKHTYVRALVYFSSTT